MKKKTLKKPKILLVEDDESVRTATKINFEEWYSITDTDKTAPALKLLEKQKYDLVLLDMFIEGEGEEGSLNVLKTINNKYPALPVIILTGTVSWMQRWNELIDIGAYGYLCKPFDRFKAKEIIDKCLNGEKMLKIV